MATPPAATAGGGVLSFDDVVKIEFDFAVRTVKRAAVKFSTSAMGVAFHPTCGRDDLEGNDVDADSLAGVAPGSHHLGTLIQALVFELLGRRRHAARDLLRAVSHELVLYGHLQSPEFYEGLGKCVSNREKMQFICLAMKDPSFDGNFVDIFADLVGSGLVSVKDASLYTLRHEPYDLSSQQARRLVLELVENVCDTVDEAVAMVRRMYHPSEVEESNACLDAILKSNFFDDIIGGSFTERKDCVQRTICDVFPAAKQIVEGWIHRHEEEDDDSDDSLDSFVVSDREIDDEFDDDSDTDTDDTTASEGEDAVDIDDGDDDSMSVDEEQPIETFTEGHGRLRKARDAPEMRDSSDLSPTAPVANDETRSNSENNDDENGDE